MRRLTIAAALPALAVACFSPEPGGNDESSATETGDSTGDTTGGSTDDDVGDDTTETGGSVPPLISDFLVNGATTPGPVTAASAVTINVAVTDADADLESVAVLLDGATLTEAPGPGPDFEFEWLVSGAELNSSYELSILAVDAEGHEASSEIISVELAMPAGGTEDDAWAFDGGVSDAAYAIVASEDGSEVVIAGQSNQQSGSRLRVDRVVGPTWQDKVESSSTYGAGVVRRDGAGYWVAGVVLAPDPVDFDSAVFGYDDSGALTQTWQFDGAKPEVDPVGDLTSGMAPTPDGGVLVLGTYSPQSGPLAGGVGNYVAKLGANGEVDWLRWPTEADETDGEPFVYELSAASDGSFALAGARVVNAQPRLWWGSFDDAGQLQEQLTVMDGDGSIAHAVHLADDGALLVAGQITVGGAAQPWTRRWAAGGAEDWTASLPASTEGVTAAVAVDDFGETVTVSTEKCVVTAVRFEECELVVRKYDAQGALMWETNFADETFSGPVFAFRGFDASLAFDRFGFIYVAATTHDADGTDWWARKLHP